MSKLIKKMQLDSLRKQFRGVRDMVLLTTDKVSAQAEHNFRMSLRAKKIRMMMVKNTFARYVLKEEGIVLKDVWDKPTFIAWGTESIKDLSKSIEATIADMVKKDPKSKDKVQIKTAVADGQQCTFEQALKMPTRLEAIGSLVAMILGPAAELASQLTGPASQLASQIASIAEKKPEETPAAS